MKKSLFAILLLALLTATLETMAENWDYVRSSGEYYYGTGHGASEKEATDMALAELTGMIATHVSSEFMGLSDEANVNSQVDHKSQVLNCVKTYSQATLRNVEKLTEQKGNQYVAYCYMKRSELENIYKERTAKAKDMLNIAREALERGKIDMALQYYYWSYSLVRSLQRPNEVKTDDGKVLMNWLPVKIEEILSNISVKFEKREDDFVDLLFFYGDQPVSSLEFTYSDGRAECHGSAKDGRGLLEMVPGYETSTYHVNIEYEYRGQARGDAEMQSVLEVVGKKVFSDASQTVAGKPGTAKRQVAEAQKTGIKLEPTATQVVSQSEAQAALMNKVIEAIRTKSYQSISGLFTLDGLDTYNKLIAYGTGRIVGTPHLAFFKSHDDRVVVRGLQMSFAFKSKTKKTYVEDVIFTLNKEGKIENVAFGLGQQTENDILCKYAPGWKEETRELLMEFLENYKTAYCLKRLDYIRDIFADDATIIIGNVTRRTSYQERGISLEGQGVISYNRYTKDEYLKNLERCFRRNEFINLRFSQSDIQWLEKYEQKELFAIQLGQEYNSSTYGDKGYLFLLVDMTDHENPQIKIRTWQPNEVDMSKIYNAGDFYQE
ncbi:MAG: hypothetical protein J6E29_03125 [Prevotella sp.]|nr:hypothetical protein [Prevotella sp.]